MGLIDWFTERRILREYTRAFKRGDFTRLNEILEAYDFQNETAAEARENLALAKALQGRPGDLALEPILAAASDAAIYDKLLPVHQSYVLNGCVASAIDSQDFELAVQHASTMRDAEVKAGALRKIAAHLAVDPARMDRAVEVLFSVPNPQYILEDLRDLIQSRAFLADFETADRMLERVNDDEGRNVLESLLRFAREHENLDDAEKAANFPYHDDRNFHLATVAGRVGDHDRMFAYLDDVDWSIRDSVIGNYAKSLAYAGRFDIAVNLVGRVDDTKMRDLWLCNLITQFPHPSQTTRDLLLELDRDPTSLGAFTAWTYETSILLFSGRAHDATSLLGSLQNVGLKNFILKILVDLLQAVRSLQS